MRYGLGRIPSPPDERDLTLADMAFPPVAIPASRLWSSARVLNQGKTGHCVGFGCAGWGIAAPVQDKWRNANGHAIYYAAKVIDGEPNAEGGSHVRSGLKVLRNLGRVDRYFWLSGVGADVDMGQFLDFLLGTGPIIVGTDWTQDMFSPDADGRIRPTGATAGGHCYLLRGAPDRKHIRIRNSWGAKWGHNGDAFITVDDMRRLLDGSGEAVAATEKALS